METENQTIEERIANLRKYRINDTMHDNPYAIWESKDPAIKRLKEVRDETQRLNDYFFPESFVQVYRKADSAVDVLCDILTSGKINTREYETIAHGTHPLIREIVDVAKESDAVIGRYNKQKRLKRWLTYLLCLNELDKLRLEAKTKKGLLKEVS